MLTMEEKSAPLIEAVYNYSEKTIANSSSAWLKNLRQDALNRFLKLGIPTTKEEDWKYTNLSELSSRSFKPAAETKFTAEDQIRRLCSKDEITFVLINGIFDEKLSSLGHLPPGVTLMPLSEAITEKENLVKTLLSKYESKNESSFIALNNALSVNGVFVQIADKTIIKKLIHILHITQSKEGILTTPRTFITAGKSSEATILETHIGVGDSVYLSVPLTDVFLDENAILHYCKAQSESLVSYHIGNTRVWQEKDSHFDGFSLMNGGAVTRNDLDIISNGEGTSSTLNGFYGVNGKQHVDNHSSMDHRLPNCTSNQLYKGILNGESHSAFNGKIFVRQIAQKTNSYQLNKNLILGVNCRVDTKPQLEIFADDVKCTHGATIGQLNEDEIFYLQTRCISKKDAIKLLAHGFVQDILNKIHDPAIIAKLNILLEPTFAALE